MEFDGGSCRLQSADPTSLHPALAPVRRLALRLVLLLVGQFLADPDLGRARSAFSGNPVWTGLVVGRTFSCHLLLLLSTVE